MLAEEWAGLRDPQVLTWARLAHASLPPGPPSLGWMEEAACRGVDPELFFPDRDGSTARIAQAKAICAGCPVLSDCRAHGERVEAELARSEWYGIVGGETVDDRLGRRG